MKNKFELNNLENLNEDSFNYLTTFMTYKKELVPLLLVSKKLNQQIKNCPAGLLAGQLLPQSMALAGATAHEFIFQNALRLKNIKPLFISLACLCLLTTGQDDLMPIYTVGLVTSLAVSIMNARNEYCYFGLFKTKRLEEIKEIEKPLYRTIDFS